jgi:all-trans-retinol 13,14-reductase
LWAFLDAHGASPALKNLLGNYSLMLCGVPGEEITFYMHTMVVGPFLQGACTLARGGDDMVSGFEGALAAAGVDTFTSRAATGLEIDGSRKLKGVRAADGEVLETPLCVCTIHPQLLQGLMPKDAVRPAYLSRLRDLRNTGGALALFLDIPGVPAAFVRRNRYFCYKEDNGSQAVLAVMASEPEAIPRKAVCVLRSLDLRNLPAGDYGGRKVPGPYRDYKQAQVARTLAMMESMAPDLRGRYKVLDAATPLTFERYTGTVNGCAYGILRGPDQIPLNPVTSVRGFYLAGQSILFPGLLGTVISGILAGQHILDMQTIWKEVKQAWRSNGSL